MTPTPFNEFTSASLQTDLPTARVGRTCIVYDRVESTNDVLRAVASDTRYDGLAVFANYQINGKGRNGHSWQAGPGTSVLCSVFVTFEGEISQLAGAVNLAACIAAAGSLRQCFGINSTIKWPNDICVAGRKLGGILIESSHTDRVRTGFVIGIGLNVTQNTSDFPAEVSDRACSVATVMGGPVDQSARVRLARQLLIELDRTIKLAADGEFDRLRAEWLSLAAGRDGMVTVEHGNRRFEGRMMDIDPRDQSLFVQDHNGLIWHLQPNVSRLLRSSSVDVDIPPLLPA